MIIFRLYYECLEQAYDYLKPIIEVVIAQGNTIELVKRPKQASQLPNGVLFAIQSLTTPDALLTGIYQNIEYPLAIIEFTEAVTTEDHELQRTYGAVAAYLSGAYYIKIAGHKQSEKEFGGAEYNPYITPRIFIDKFQYHSYIIADWQTQIDNNYTLQQNAELPACPPTIPILTDTLQAIIIAFQKDVKTWFTKSLELLSQKSTYQNYKNHIDAATSATELLTTWKEREHRNKKRNQLRYFVQKDWVGAKINRFSHAMDPDRGILTFISFMYSDKYKIFGVYALVRPRSTDALKKDITTLPELKQHLDAALAADETGIPKWFIDELKQITNTATSLNQIIDFQPIWLKHKAKIAENKVIATLAFFLDGLYLNHNGIKLTWNRHELLNTKKTNHSTALQSYFGFNTYTNPVPIQPEINEIDEDEVTYTIVHRLLIPNKFKIVSISYPGAQGGNAILPKPHLGKAQPREYPDIIALPPQPNPNIDILLNESKGMFNQAKVQRDTDKILRYKNDPNLQDALKNTLVVAQVIDTTDTVRNIIIGVAFGVTTSTSTTWQPNQVDFIFRITNRQKWAIGIFNQALRDLIPIIEGTTDFPTVYKIAKKNKKNNSTLF